MTATKDYLLGTISEAAQKALAIPIADVRIEDGKVLIEIDPKAGEAPFWAAIQEQE
jgi:hypothetical protein